jgi:hypothetical protein
LRMTTVLLVLPNTFHIRECCTLQVGLVGFSVPRLNHCLFSVYNGVVNHLSFPNTIPLPLSSSSSPSNPFTAMVLQNTRATNLAKDENAPPTPSTRPKGLVSKIYEDASSRGRTRSSGTSNTSKYRLEQAKRARRKAKARGSVRLTVPTPPTAVDVEMSNATSSSSSSRTPICLQSELLRPHYKEVSLENIRDVEPVLEDLSLKTIRLGLEATSSQ